MDLKQSIEKFFWIFLFHKHLWNKPSEQLRQKVMVMWIAWPSHPGGLMSHSTVPDTLMSHNTVPDTLMSHSTVPDTLMSQSTVPDALMSHSTVPDTLSQTPCHSSGLMSPQDCPSHPGDAISWNWRITTLTVTTALSVWNPEWFITKI